MNIKKMTREELHLLSDEIEKELNKREDRLINAQKAIDFISDFVNKEEKICINIVNNHGEFIGRWEI